MTEQHWITTAFANDALVAELLLRLKQSSSSDSDSSDAQLRWGRRKRRSKHTATGADGFGKEQHRASPTTPLYWTGDGGASTSDGYDGSGRPGGRSVKAAFANEGATTYSYKKSRKRKSFDELKEAECFLLKERVKLNRELASRRVTWNKQTATSENLKKIKFGLQQNSENEMATLGHGPKTRVRGFVLPDLNMTPNDDLRGESGSC